MYLTPWPDPDPKKTGVECQGNPDKVISGPGLETKSHRLRREDLMKPTNQHLSAPCRGGCLVKDALVSVETSPCLQQRTRKRKISDGER
jgi:hypothetical protein